MVHRLVSNGVPSQAPNTAPFTGRSGFVALGGSVRIACNVPSYCGWIPFDSGMNDAFSGEIAEFQIYNRAIKTTAEVCSPFRNYSITLQKLG